MVARLAPGTKTEGYIHFLFFFFLHPHNTSCHLIAGWHPLSAANFAADNLESTAGSMVTMAVVQAKVQHDWFPSSHPSSSSECSQTNQIVVVPLYILPVYTSSPLGKGAGPKCLHGLEKCLHQEAEGSRSMDVIKATVPALLCHIH